MNVTEVSVKLAGEQDPGDRVLAYCSVVFDQCFVVRDVKIIDGAKGAFVAMPSRRISVHCLKCKVKNPITNHFCGECGVELDNRHHFLGGRRVYNDACHPITQEFREILEKAVFAAYDAECEKDDARSREAS